MLRFLSACVCVCVLLPRRCGVYMMREEVGDGAPRGGMHGAGNGGIEREQGEGCDEGTTRIEVKNTDAAGVLSPPGTVPAPALGESSGRGANGDGEAACTKSAPPQQQLWTAAVGNARTCGGRSACRKPFAPAGHVERNKRPA